MKRFLLDAGPVVALLNRSDRHHPWARSVFESVIPPALTSQAVLSEACFLVRHLRGGPSAVLALVERGIVLPAFRLEVEIGPVRRLMTKYADVPMSLADASLVRMSEQSEQSIVVTIDGDFRIYRRHRRKPIPVLMPEG